MKTTKALELYCSIDWLSVTSKILQGEVSPEKLLTERTDGNGWMGYKSSYHYESGIVHLWSEDRPEIHCVYSGKTLRNISEIMSIQELIQWHSKQGHRVTRIDTAIDVMNTGARIIEFAQDWKKGTVKTHARSGTMISDPRDIAGDTFYVGSRKKKRKLLRIYDKAKEQRIDKDWLRFEMQYGGGAARSCASAVAHTDSLSKTFRGQLRAFCEFSHPVYQMVIGNSEPMPVRHDMPSGVDKRLLWLWTSALPAMVTLEQEKPGMVQILMNEVYERIERLNDGQDRNENTARHDDCNCESERY